MHASLPSLELNASPLEELTPGLTFQWLFDRQVMAFYAEHSARTVVDVWADKIISVCHTWPPSRRLLMLNDFSGKNCAMTPYNQQKNRDLLKMFPHIQVANVTVVKQNLTMVLARLFLRAISGEKDKQVLLTFSRDEGLDWLKKQIENAEISV